MEPDAYRRLDRCGLPHPGSWSLAEARSIPESVDWVYVRTSNAHPLRGPQRRSDLVAEIDRRDAPGSPSGAQVDELVESDAGCVIVKTGTYTYTEYVAGHLSGLLRRGELFARSLSTSGTNLLLKRKQPWELRLTNGRFREVTANVRSFDRLLANMQLKIAPWLRKVPTSTLVEVMVSQRGATFVDIKSYPWKVDFHRIFEGSSPAVLYGTVQSNSPIYEGAFDLTQANNSYTTQTIKLANRAALCHFVTYSLRHGAPALVT